MGIKTQEELKKTVACNCLELPCIHNPEISEDILVEIKIPGHKTKKGVTYVYLDKSKFQMQEETAGITKYLVLS